MRDLSAEVFGLGNGKEYRIELRCALGSGPQEPRKVLKVESRSLVSQSPERHRRILKDGLAILIRDPSLLGDALGQVTRQCLIAPPRAPDSDPTPRRQFDLLRLERAMVDSHRMSRPRQVFIRSFRPGGSPLEQSGLAVPAPLLGPEPRLRHPA
jgi:hypothetical protein